MNGAERDSGIDLLGYIPWGTHICQFYKTPEDLTSILVPYFKAGLENNEFCLWVTARPLGRRRALAAMRKAMPDFALYLRNGQIEVVPYDQWYLRDGIFDRQVVLERWIDKLDHALKQGYDGLRVTGNTSWLQKNDWKTFIEYEEEQNKVISKYRMIAICTYSLNRRSATEVIDVVNNHQFALIRRQDQWQLMESTEHKEAKDAHLKAEEESGNSDELLNNIIEQTPNALWISDEKGIAIRMNQALRDMLKITDEEIIGKYNVLKDRQVIEQGFAPLVKSVFEEGKTVNFTIDYDTAKEKQIKLSQTTHRILDTVISAVKNREGKVIYAICQHRDITEQEKAKAALTESEQRYRTLFETTGAATILIEEDRTISLMNSELERVSGYSQKEIVGKKWTDFVVKEDLGRLQEYHDLRRTNPKAAPRQYECRLVDKQGNIKTFLMTVDVIPGTKKSIASFVEITERKRMEEALQNSEEKLRVMFQSMAEGITVIDMEGHILEMNDTAVRLRGYSNKAEIIGRSYLEILSPENRARVMNNMNKVLTEGRGELTEYTALRKDGTKFPIETNSALMRNASGNPIGIITLTRDITERKRAEEALRESERKYRQLVALAQEGIWAIDAESKTVFANPKMVQMLGYTAEEMMGRSLFSFMDEHGISLAKTYVEQRKITTSEKYEFEFICKDGTRIYAMVGSSPITDAKGNFVGALAVVTDITQRKLAEEELRKSEEKLRIMFQSVAEGIIVIDMKGHILDVNEAAVRMLGYVSKYAMIGRNSLEFISPADHAKATKRMKKTVAEGQSAVAEYTLLRKDGSEFTVEINASLIKDTTGKPMVVIGVSRDISQRKRMEETLRESEERYRSLVTNIPDIVWTTNSQGDYVFMSPNNEAITGYTPEEMYQGGYRMLFENIHPDDVKMLMEKLGPQVETGRPFDVEYRFRRKDGEWVWLHTRTTAAYEKDGTTYIDGVSTDITERKRAEEALRQSEERFRRLAENAQDIIYHYRVEPTPRFEYVSPAVTVILGYTPEEYYADPDMGLKIILPEDRPVLEAMLPSSDRWAVPVIFREFCKDGTIVWIEEKNVPIYDQAGNLVAVEGIARNITERKKAEEALRQSESKYRQLVELAQEGIWAIDAESKTVFANPKMAQMLGYTVEEMLGRSLFSFMDEYGAYIAKDLVERRKAGVSEEHDFEFIRKDGTKLYASLGTAPITDDKGNYSGALAVAVDVTQRKLSEEARLKAEESFHRSMDESPGHSAS